MIIKHHHSVKKPQTASVTKRNLRERRRVKGVNDGFGKLKQYVPNMRDKSSKVETIRGAIEYIKTLQEILGQEVDMAAHSDREIKLEEEDDMKDDFLLHSDNDSSGFEARTLYEVPSPYPDPSPFIPVSYNLHRTQDTPAVTRLPSLESIRKEKCIGVLPPMSITAPSWWPQK